MHSIDQTILPEHISAARMWGLGGRDYNQVSFAISDALAHAAQRLSPLPGEEVLDIATGTGWTARNAARAGATVTAIDFSEELLEAAEELSSHLRPRITFIRADAEHLPFADASFDRVVSTFGVMFATDHEKAAAEIARVTRPGGRLVLASWVPGDSVEAFFGIVGRHSGAPAPKASPFAWGVPESMGTLLGDHFDLTFERGINNAYHEDTAHIWEWYSRGFGPIRAMIESLEPDRLEAFRHDIDSFHEHYKTETGMLHVRRAYLLTIGKRKA